MNSPSILSKSAFAARHGIARSTVSKWISRGQLTGDAITATGRIRIAVAEAQLCEQLDSARSQTAINGGGDDAAGLIKRQREQRLAEGAIRLRRLRREELAERGRYALASDVERERNRGIRQLVEALGNWLAVDVPLQLGLDDDARVALRQAWRKFCEREAGAAQARADAMPEFIGDPDEEAAEAGGEIPHIDVSTASKARVRKPRSGDK
jgi:hypothetical protein